MNHNHYINANIMSPTKCNLAITRKMVGEDTLARSYSLENVLTEEHVTHIIRQVTASDVYELLCSEAKPAAEEGLNGFLGDHIRVVLHLKLKDEMLKVHLFVKRLPIENKPKAEFIEENNFFKREKLMLELLHEMKGADGPNPWCSTAYVYTDSLVVMPDLAVAGYSEHPLLETFDYQHVMLTASALARFHAAFANLETKRILASTRQYSFYEEHKHLIVEPVFKDTPWVRTAAKLTADLLDVLSLKYSKSSVPGLEEKLAKSYIEACNSLDLYESTLNVMLHKDMWNNNILFKYEEGIPTNAILVDYQCARYAPPAFDVVSFLYLTTSRTFREEHESDVLNYYFKVFSHSLEEATKKRIDAIEYDENEFLSWCEKSRQFGIFEAVALFPQVLMDGRAAQKTFDDPETYVTIVERDRSKPVLEYAQQFPLYKERQLEVAEEYVERFICTC